MKIIASIQVSQLICAVLFLLMNFECVSLQKADIENDINFRYLQEFDKSRGGLQSMRDTISSLDKDLETYQKRTCALGINSHHCSLASLDSVMQSSEWLKSGFSPGKRSAELVQDPVFVEKVERLLEDISKKRSDLQTIGELLDQANDNLSIKQKRTCRLQLGGACRTEMASAIADQYYYLHSPQSPGKRKRRSTELLKTLLSRT
ncbi:hypothetical protein ACJMK2_020225 [Sinanodonta woodiana]|uniref:Uncharacterized protein n=1 Tax=Sinanodonta woodiana TaxID=1069815 RepID=A0ABD3U0L2_SINWO